MQNKSLDEVEHPETRARLEGIQGVVYDIGNQVLEYREKIKAHKAAKAQVGITAETLFHQCVPINKLVDEDEMDKDEAKLRIDQIKRDVELVRGIEARLQEEIDRFKGALLGFEEAIKVSGARFDNEVNKYERHQRIEAESDDGDVDDLGRTAEERQQKFAAQANPNPESKQDEKMPEKAKKQPLKKKAKRKAG